MSPKRFFDTVFLRYKEEVVEGDRRIDPKRQVPEK
jgi:hypothetical protein